MNHHLSGEALVLAGSVVLLASLVLDFGDIGDALGGLLSMFGIGAGCVVAGAVLLVLPHLWWLALVAGLLVLVATSGLQHLLKSSATEPVAELGTLVGTELVLTTGTDATGHGGTASIEVAGVGNRVLVDADSPLGAGQRVWVREVLDHGSRLRVEPIN